MCKKILIYFFFIFGVSVFFVEKVFAICPVCTVGVASGLGLCRWVGIADLITGLWIGGLTVSVIIWTLDWFKKKKLNFKGIKILTIIGYYALVVVPLYYTEIISNSISALYYCLSDNLLIGIIIGSAGFYFGASWYNFLKEKNNGHAYFPFQKVAMPIGILIILTVIIYLFV
ncbi:hypothetical protein KJ671_02000 [Patescibacteria group bacterium]|nr:hypothetical protein [Patescibacteria group bacterium]